MDPTANRELIQRLYAAMQAGDQAAMLSLMSEDVRLIVPGPAGLGAAGTWQGHEGARECFRRLGEGHVTESIRFHDLIADADKVVSRLHVVAKAKATGAQFESDILHVFTVRDGKVSELHDFFDTAALAKAYGQWG